MTNYYSELTQLFDAWRTRWTEQYRTYQILPLEVANAFQTFLGCREYFDEDGTTRTKKTRYVSPAKAVWGEEQGLFRLNAMKPRLKTYISMKMAIVILAFELSWNIVPGPTQNCHFGFFSGRK